MNEDQKRLGNISLSIITALVVAVVILMTCLSCSPINKWLGKSDDWWGEQVAEEVIDEVIENKTGVDPEIDLTP